MATNFPASLDTLTNPSATDTLDSPPHDEQHADANDAIEALQAKVGVDSSAVTTSLDYRVGQLETGGGGMTVSSTAPSSPAEGDMWYDDTSGRTYVYYDDGSSQQWVEFGAPPSGIGKILQVLQTVKTDGFTTSSTSFVDVTGLSVTITPTAASSKVLVMVQGFGSNDVNYPGLINLVRDSTNVAQSTGSSLSDQTLVFSTTYDHDTTTIGITFLDSPATTSATTYKVQLRSSGGGAVQAIGRREINNGWQGVTTITVMEVSA